MYHPKRENADDQGAIGFYFASDWLRGWGEFSAAITKQSKSKPMESWITFNTQSKITLFYNLHMVESLPPPEWFTQRNKFEIIFRLKGEEPVWPNLTLEGRFL